MDQGKSQQVTIVLRVLRSYDAEAGGALGAASASTKSSGTSCTSRHNVITTAPFQLGRAQSTALPLALDALKGRPH